MPVALVDLAYSRLCDRGTRGLRTAKLARTVTRASYRLSASSSPAWRGNSSAPVARTWDARKNRWPRRRTRASHRQMVVGLWNLPFILLATATGMCPATPLSEQH